jgi:hypothetical protein
MFSVFFRLACSTTLKKTVHPLRFVIFATVIPCSHESAAMWVNFLMQEMLPDSAETQLPSLETSLRYPNRVAPRPVGSSHAGITTANLTQTAGNQEDGRPSPPEAAPLPYQELLVGVSEHVRQGLRQLREKPYELYGDAEHAWCLLCAGGSDIDSYVSRLQHGVTVVNGVDPYEETPVQTILEEPGVGETPMETDTLELDIQEQASMQKLLNAAEGHKGKARHMSRVRNAFHLGSKKLIVPNTPSQVNLGARIVELNRKTKRQQFHAAAFDPVSDG